MVFLAIYLVLHLLSPASLNYFKLKNITYFFLLWKLNTITRPQERLTDHCPEIEISNWPFFVNQQKPACIYALLLPGRWLSHVKYFYKVKKQISMRGMTATTAFLDVNEGPWKSFLKENGWTGWLNRLRMKNWSTQCKIMNNTGIFPLLEKRKQIIFHFKISIVNTEST